MPGKALDETERTAMMGRLLTLNRAIGARDDVLLAEMLAKMIAGYRSERGDNAEEIIAAMVETLRDQPISAALVACEQWPKGAFGPASPFAPSASELREAAMKVAAPFVKEANDLEAALSARLVPEAPEVRERINAGFDSLRDELRGKVVARKAEEQAKRKTPPIDLAAVTDAQIRASGDFVESGDLLVSGELLRNYRERSI